MAHAMIFIATFLTNRDACEERKEVVDSNLLPLKITIHMLMALIILALLILLLYKMNNMHLFRKKVISSKEFH